MIGVTEYFKTDFSFGKSLVTSRFENGERRKIQKTILKIHISPFINTDDNWLMLLNEESGFYSYEVRRYIKRYKKFMNFIRENKGKTFFSFMPEHLLTGNRLEDSGTTLRITGSDFCFRSFLRDTYSVTFITDYDLIEFDPTKSPKYYKKIIENIFINNSSSLLLDIDYNGRSIC